MRLRVPLCTGPYTDTFATFRSPILNGSPCTAFSSFILTDAKRNHLLGNRLDVRRPVAHHLEVEMWDEGSASVTDSSNLLTGFIAIGGSLILSALALLFIGAGMTLLTGRSVLYSGFRQIGIRLAAAILTYGVGTLIGVTLSR